MPEKYYTCPECNGEGEVAYTQRHPSGAPWLETSAREICDTCRGEGVITLDEWLNIEIDYPIPQEIMDAAGAEEEKKWASARGIVDQSPHA